jgi:hypothetical protein
MGISIRTFVDPDNTDRVGPIAEIPDMDAALVVLVES